jgi:hypothetical protein
VTALLFAWSYGQFLRPQPKAWTRGDIVVVSITLTLVCLFTFSLAYLGVFLFKLGSETRWLEIVAVTGGALLVCWFLVPRLIAPALQARPAQSALRTPSAGTVPEPAKDPHPTPPVRPAPTTVKSDTHRAA